MGGLTYSLSESDAPAVVIDLKSALLGVGASGLVLGDLKTNVHTLLGFSNVG